MYISLLTHNTHPIHLSCLLLGDSVPSLSSYIGAENFVLDYFDCCAKTSFKPVSADPYWKTASVVKDIMLSGELMLLL